MRCGKQELLHALDVVYGVKEKITRDGQVKRVAKLLLGLCEITTLKPCDCKAIGDVITISYSLKFLKAIEFQGSQEAADEYWQRWTGYMDRFITELIRKGKEKKPQTSIKGHKHCTTCSVEYPDFASFCRQCGGKLANV